MNSMAVAVDEQTTAVGAPKDGLAYVRGETGVPLSNATIGEFLLDTAARHADRCALVFREQKIRRTWRELAHEVDVVAAGLSALGIGKGDRVGIWSPNRFEWVLTQFATARIGAVLVNINPAYRLAEVEYALCKVGCKALVVAEAFKSSKYLEMLQELAPELENSKPAELRAKRLPELRMIIRMGDGKTPGMLNFSEVESLGQQQFDQEKLAALAQTLDCDDPINIQFTSGTTGSPKGATLTHRNVVNNARFVAKALRLTADDSLCIPVPLYHCFGMVLGVLACVSDAKQGIPSRADAEKWGRSIETGMDRGVHVPDMQAGGTTLADLLDRYLEEISPTKRSGSSDKSRVALVCKRLGAYKLTALTPKLLAEHRDEKLRALNPQGAQVGLRFECCLVQLASPSFSQDQAQLP